MIIRKKLSDEETLDALLTPKGYTKEGVKVWLDANIDTDGLTTDEIRSALGKTTEEMPDGYIDAIIQFYSDDFEVLP